MSNPNRVGTLLVPLVQSISMFEQGAVLGIARNLAIYGVGIALAVAGALGLAEAIELPPLIAGPLLVVGLIVVIVVHEYLGGPL